MPAGKLQIQHWFLGLALGDPKKLETTKELKKDYLLICKLYKPQGIDTRYLMITMQDLFSPLRQTWSPVQNISHH